MTHIGEPVREPYEVPKPEKIPHYIPEKTPVRTPTPQPIPLPGQPMPSPTRTPTREPVRVNAPYREPAIIGNTVISLDEVPTTCRRCGRELKDFETDYGLVSVCPKHGIKEVIDLRGTL